ncbi:MAG: BamA/TamA family outer membrane protein [Myxococcota bacterium]
MLILAAFSASILLGQSLTEDLGQYERLALEKVLRESQLEIDPEPEGKQIGEIVVRNLPVFSEEQDGFLTTFNVLHRTTRDYIIQREVLLEPGDIWDEAKVFETKRNLRDPIFTSLVVAVPVKSKFAGQVDLLVITRDIWSLRLNTDFEFQDGRFTRLLLSATENNLFGYRKRFAVTYSLDQGSFSIGPQYIDPNIYGTRLVFSHSSGLVFARETSEQEGSFSTTSFSLPLFALDRKWGFQTTVAHSSRNVRTFIGTELRTYDNPDTLEVETIPRVFRQRSLDLDASVTRQFPGAFNHLVQVGYRLARDRPEANLPDGTTEENAMAFERDVLGRSETRTGPFVEYSMFERDFKIYRNVDTFDFPEDTRAGPTLSLQAAFNPEGLGSDVNSVNLLGTAGWTLPFGADSFARLSLSGSARAQDSELLDRLFNSDFFLATPTLLRIARLVLNAEYDRLDRETINRFIVLGGDTGLRGFPIGAFTGDRRAVINVEVRTIPIQVWFLRAGLLAFFDTGHAWDVNLGVLSDEFRETAPDFRFDYGLGLRVVAPQSNTLAWRLDWALASEGPDSSLPGRITAGFGQTF